MKRINDLGLIILLSLGVVFVIYWVKQTPAVDGDKVKTCVEAKQADTAGSAESRQNPAAWEKSIEAACKAN